MLAVLVGSIAVFAILYMVTNWIIKPINEKPDNAVKSNCAHEHWEVRGSNTVGYGQCLDCNREVNLADLFDALRNRMVSSIEKDRQ